MIYYHSTNNKINKTIKKLIMKRAILSVLLLFAFLTGFAQNRNICRLGITYDISQSDHWGKNKPVITSVIPYSPAELAGVKCGFTYSHTEYNKPVPLMNDVRTEHFTKLTLEEWRKRKDRYENWQH